MRRFLCPLILILSIFLLAGCSKEGNQDQSDHNQIPSQTSIEFSHKGHTFQIIPLYEQVLDYTKTAQSHPSINKETTYLKKVVEPFQKIASKKKVDIGTRYFPYFSYDPNIQQLQKNTIKLLKHQKQINNLIKNALIKSAKNLPPHSKKTVFVMPLNSDNNFVINRMEGVSGITFNKEFILLKIDPSFTEDILKYSTAHEYQHTVRFESQDMPQNLLGKILLEGRADAFARIVYPNIKAPWTKPLSGESKKTVLDVLGENINSIDTNLYNDFFGGNASKGIPAWSNYKIGYEISQSYIKNHPEVSIEKWTNLSAKEILKGSQYSHIIKE